MVDQFNEAELPFSHPNQAIQGSTCDWKIHLTQHIGLLLLLFFYYNTSKYKDIKIKIIMVTLQPSEVIERNTHSMLF